MSACPRCIERGTPKNFGEPARCAFVTGVFSSENWQCATANAIRDLVMTGHEPTAGVAAAYNAETTAVLVPVELDGDEDDAVLFLLVSWYKRRGTTDLLHVVYGGMVNPITLAQAEKVIPALERSLMGVVETPKGAA